MYSGKVVKLCTTMVAVMEGDTGLHVMSVTSFLHMPPRCQLAIQGDWGKPERSPY